MTRQEEIVKGFNESWSQYGINVSSNISNPINGITVNNPNGGRAVALNFIDGVNATKLTAAQIAALPNPQAGQIVYQTDGSTGLYVYDGASWATLGGLSSVIGTTNRITVTGGNTIDIASTYVGQTSITTLGTITTGTWTGIIGQATMTLGSDATGDIYYRNSGGNLTRLGIGSSGQVLGVSAGLPAWQASGSGITVGSTTITSGTSGRIAFNSSGVYGESANLFWDNSNNNLGLKTSTPTSTLQIGGTSVVSGSVFSNWAGWDVNISSGTSLTTGTKTALLFGKRSDTNGDFYIQTASTGVDYGRLFLQYFSIAGSLPALKGIVIIGDGSDASNAAKLNVTNGPILTPPVLAGNPNTGGSTYASGMCYALISPTYPSGIGLDGSYSMWFQSAPTIGTGFKWYQSTTQIMTLTSSGNLGIGVTSPTARVDIGAGVATSGGAPLKLTAGTNLTTPENGAFEFDGTNLFFTVGGVRKTVTLV
jgi:hypothetical protein